MTVVPYLHSSRAPVTVPPPAPRVSADISLGDVYLHIHTILIVIIFCTVCFLLLVAFFYAFCFHCTLRDSPKDGSQGAAFTLEREDATFRRTSSCPSLGNTI